MRESEQTIQRHFPPSLSCHRARFIVRSNEKSRREIEIRSSRCRSSSCSSHDRSGGECVDPSSALLLTINNMSGVGTAVGVLVVVPLRSIDVWPCPPCSVLLISRRCRCRRIVVTFERKQHEQRNTAAQSVHTERDAGTTNSLR